jgi:hypothetical protein
MISLKELLLCEVMSFKDLMAAAGTDAGRLARSKGMRVKSLRPVFDDDGESMIFSYKSSPATSTTKKRYQGYIKLSNADLKRNKSKDDINCIVDCQCPDFKYRFAYWDSKEGASVTGNNSWNKNNGATPKKYGKRIGLCKHLISIADYLKTQIDSKINAKKTLKEHLTEGVFKDKFKDSIEILKKQIAQLEMDYDRLDSQGQSTATITKDIEELKNDLFGLELLYNDLP